MHKKKSIVGGIILITVGIFVLLAQTIPGFAGILDISLHWPFIFIAIGGLLLISAFFGSAELAFPGSVMTGLGLIFYYQNISGNWASWAYVWALIPGFVGLGMYLTATLDSMHVDKKSEGKRLVLISGALFLVFGFFFNFSASIGRFWPVLLIAAGIWILFKSRQSNKP
jgi:hypothetical protein